MAWNIVPFQLMDLLDPPFDKNAAPWSWLNLGQRSPFMGVALFVWLTSVCIGRLCLRTLRLCMDLDRVERLFFAACLGLAAVSLVMLGLGLIGVLNRWPLVMILATASMIEVWLTRRNLPAG